MKSNSKNRDTDDNYPPPPRFDALLTPTRLSFMSKKLHRKTERKVQSVIILSPKRSTAEMGQTKESTPKTINDSPLSPPAKESPNSSSSRLTNIISMKFRKSEQTLQDNSLPSSPLIMKRMCHSAPTSPNKPFVDEIQMNSLSPMIQDLLRLELATKPEREMKNILLPSLAKPRATSFLTGQEELIRSSENDPTEWQLEIPHYDDVLLSAKLCQYLSDSHKVTNDPYTVAPTIIDHVNSATLQSINSAAEAIVEHHRQAVPNFLQCSNGTAIVEVQEYLTSTHNNNVNEVLIVSLSQKFLCIFAGATSEKNGKLIGGHKTIHLMDGSIVYENHYSAFATLQSSLFNRLDKLTDESPFCDVSFAGHNVDAAIAMVAAHTYANTRPAIRVSCVLFGATKISPTSAFRRAVHSTPNLNVCQLQFDNIVGMRQNHMDRLDVGHQLLLKTVQGKDEWFVQAYRFGFICNQAGHTQNTGFSILPQKKTKDLSDFVLVLGKIERNSWVKRFFMDDRKII